MRSMFQKLNGVTLVVTIVIYASVFTGRANITGSVKYQNYFSPAGYAFSIRRLMYLGMRSFVFYDALLFKHRKDKRHALMPIGHNTDQSIWVQQNKTNLYGA